jgi:hypothetical protein
MQCNKVEVSTPRWATCLTIRFKHLPLTATCLIESWKSRAMLLVRAVLRVDLNG